MTLCACIYMLKETASDLAILFLSICLKEKNSEVRIYLHATFIEALFVFHNNQKAGEIQMSSYEYISYTNEILFSL